MAFQVGPQEKKSTQYPSLNNKEGWGLNYCYPLPPNNPNLVFVWGFKNKVPVQIKMAGVQ